MGDMADMLMEQGLEAEYDGAFDGDVETLIGTSIIHQTELAVLVMHNDRTAWFPKSVISNLSTLFEGAVEYDYRFDPTWEPVHRTKCKAIEGDF